MTAQRERVPAPAGTGAATEVFAAIGEMPVGRWLVAVSGGRDSMALMHALATARGGQIAAVANFDHGTGPHARRAMELVEHEGGKLGLSIVTGSATQALPFNEGAWRSARHAFLDAWALELNATVVTAHTRDDEIETVVQRFLRDAGPRGLAGMRASPPPSGATARVRPLLAVARETVAAYAASRGVRWVDDPSNDDRAFQRNRIRHEILPALERARPGFGEWCWDLGARAAAWRADVDALVESLDVTVPAPGSAVVPAGRFDRCEVAEWQVLWPAIAALAGVVMDRRGIERAAAWAPVAKAGQEIPLSGDARIIRTAQTFVVRGTP